MRNVIDSSRRKDYHFRGRARALLEPRKTGAAALFALILPQNCQNLPLNGESRLRNVDRLHGRIRGLQANFLFTYLPNPGTVVYFGYGNTSQQPDLAGRTQLGAVQSNFFLKLSYLWRMRG